MDAKLSFGRSLDANDSSFASKSKPFQDRELSACNEAFGRFGRKFPEHFIEEARGERPEDALIVSHCP